MHLTSENFRTYAAMHYRNEHCISDEEFQEDLDRIKYIKKLFSAYRKSNELKERLVLNHIVVLYNIFEPRALTKMLLFKLQDSLDCLVPFLVFLGYVEDKKYIIDGKEFNPLHVKMDQVIIEKLRKIKYQNG